MCSEAAGRSSLWRRGSAGRPRTAQPADLRGEQHASMTVRPLPPRLSISSCVSLLSRYGTGALRSPRPEDRSASAEMTCAEAPQPRGRARGSSARASLREEPSTQREGTLQDRPWQQSQHLAQSKQAAVDVSGLPCPTRAVGHIVAPSLLQALGPASRGSFSEMMQSTRGGAWRQRERGAQIS